MASITSLGVGSGIFSNDLVRQLVSAERAPTEQRLNSRQSEAEAQISAFGKIRSALESLKGVAEELNTAENLRAYVGTSSNANVVSATVDSAEANRGSYSLNVMDLAQAQSLASGAFADRDATSVGTGTLTLNVGGVATDITVDTTNNTLEGLAASINDAGAGVSAGIVDTGSGYRLVLSSDETGTANSISVSAVDDDGDNADALGLSQFGFDGTTSNMEETVVAKDARMEINGIEVTRSSNTVEGVVDGVTFNLKSLGTSSVDVQSDPDEVAGRVQEFVDKFNTLKGEIKRYSGFNDDAGKGILSGDATLRGLETDLRQMLVTIPGGLEDSPVRMLADIGISTNPDTGKLDFDQTKFKDQLKAAPDDVAALFAKTDTADGIAERLVTSVSNYLANDGALASRTEGLNRTLENIQEQRERLDLRIESYEARLIRQFSAADSLISQIQSTGDYVTQQLAALTPKTNSQG